MMVKGKTTGSKPPPVPRMDRRMDVAMKTKRGLPQLLKSIMKFGTRNRRTLGEPPRFCCQGKENCCILEAQSMHYVRRQGDKVCFPFLESPSDLVSGLEATRLQVILLLFVLSAAKVFKISKGYFSISIF